MIVSLYNHKHLYRWIMGGEGIESIGLPFATQRSRLWRSGVRLRGEQRGEQRRGEQRRGEPRRGDGVSRLLERRKSSERARPRQLPLAGAGPSNWEWGN